MGASRLDDKGKALIWQCSCGVDDEGTTTMGCRRQSSSEDWGWRLGGCLRVEGGGGVTEAQGSRSGVGGFDDDDGLMIGMMMMGLKRRE